MALTPVSFAEAMKLIGRAKNRHLLLGNGFSIALKPDIFTYGSLFENADFSNAPNIVALFTKLETQDFEVAIRHIQDAISVLTVYSPATRELISTLGRDASTVKDALVSAIAKRHPNRPYDITNAEYAACRVFLRYFGHIFTLNYDVLLYWTLMQDEVDGTNLKPDDGFRHPESNRDAPYCSGPGSLNRFSASLSGVSAEVRLPCGWAAG
jgi:hypothetical protein